MCMLYSVPLKTQNRQVTITWSLRDDSVQLLLQFKLFTDTSNAVMLIPSSYNIYNTEIYDETRQLMRVGVAQ